jgi:hypothetical protein
VDSGEVGLISVEVVLKGVSVCGKKCSDLLPAGLSEGKNFIQPAVAPF